MIDHQQNNPDEADTMPEPTFILGCPELLAQVFQALYDTADWGDAPAGTETPACPVYPPGPIAAGQGSLAARRLDDPEARFHSAMMWAEAWLPICVAHNAEEKMLLIGEIGQVLGLDVATEKGWIDGFVVCWSRGRFPKVAEKLRILTAPGRRSRSQVLGSLEPHIRKFVDSVLSAIA